MTTKKQLLKQIEELKATLNSTNTDFMSQQEMLRKLQYEIAKTRAAVLDEGDSTIQTTCSEYDDISKNVIPTGWSWMYWKFINQLTFYWLGRYSDYESEEKEEIELTKYIAIMYGIGGYSKSDKKAYYITLDRDKKNYMCYPARNFVQDGRYIGKIDGSKTKWSMNLDGVEGVSKPIDDIIVCTWRFGDIGNFIWYLQDALYFLLTKQIVICNAANLTNPLYIKVNNKSFLKSDEYKKLLSPLTNVKAIVNSGDYELPSKANMIGNFSASIDKDAGTVNYANELILTTKFIQEQFYTIFGIPITSSKNQSLSADANLSVTLCNNIAKEHDRRIEAFHKALGIEFNLEEPEFQPQNENADKGGMGENANTDGDKVEKGEWMYVSNSSTMLR